MATEQKIIKQGYLHKWKTDADTDKSSWQPQFFILHGPSHKNAARLDWYDSEDQFHQNPRKRKALFMEEIKRCEQVPFSEETKKIYGSSAKYILFIHTYRTSTTNYILKCGSEELLKEWYDQLTKLLQDVRTLSKAVRAAVVDKPLDQNDIYNPNYHGAPIYEVEIDDTAAAIHCELQGSYLVILSQQHITLADPDTRSPVITWLYKHIRRFGYSDKSLTIEGGSKCGIGQGLFIFKTNHGTELMDAINEKMKQCKSQPENDYSYVTGVDVKKFTQEPSVSENKKTGKKSAAAKPSEMEKPSTSPTSKPATNSNGKIPSSHISSSPQHQQPQPKMSEVLMHMNNNQVTQEAGTEDDVYSHLNLKGTVSKGSTTAIESENPYGEQLKSAAAKPSEMGKTSTISSLSKATNSYEKIPSSHISSTPQHQQLQPKMSEVLMHVSDSQVTKEVLNLKGTVSKGFLC